MKLAYKLVIPLLAILMAAFILDYLITDKLVTDIFVSSRTNNLSTLVGIRALSFTNEDLLQDPNSSILQNKFKEFRTIESSIYRVKVWDKDLKIVYSDLSRTSTQMDNFIENVKSDFSIHSQGEWSGLNKPNLSISEGKFGSFIVGTVPLKNNNGQTIYVVELYFSMAIITDNLNEFAKNISVFLAMTTILIIVFEFIVLSIFVLRPIKLLKISAETIGSGDLKERAQESLGDEIGLLGKAFNEMAEKLGKSYSVLEQRVWEKTKEITEQMETIKEKNKSLEDNKKAMMNLLEDAKNLESLLKTEKEGVEKKVEERTEELSHKTQELLRANDEINLGWMKLQQEKARLIASIQSLPQGFFMIDNNNNILVSNSNVLKILEVEKINYDEIIELFKDSIDLKKYYISAITEEKMYEFKDIMYKGKHLRLFLVSIVVLQNNKKESIGVATVIEDITNAKVLERSRDEFFSIASHELRTPLTAIKGNASLIQEHFVDKINSKDFSEMITDIHDSSIRLIEIVNDFLDSSRLEQGKMMFSKEVFDIIPLIEKVVYEEGVSTKEKNIYLKFDQSAGSLPFVVADSNKTKQIMYNLIGNAIKFTESGGVTISAQQRDNNICIYVSDTGKGIPIQSQSLLFRKFQQAENNILTRESSRGTGLGLYISKLMAEGMGGSISLEKSEEGKGSTFILTLPVSSKKEETVQLQETPDQNTAVVPITPVSQTPNVASIQA